MKEFVRRQNASGALCASGTARSSEIGKRISSFAFIVPYLKTKIKSQEIIFRFFVV